MAEGPSMYGQGPEAGWYPDPEGAGLRWWDGTAWTAHVHVGHDDVPSPAAAPATEPAPAGDRRPPARALALAAVLVVAVAAAAFLLLRSSDDDSSTTSASNAAPGPAEVKPPGHVAGPRAAFDAFAKERVHTAQVAIETYATEHGGSYTGATSAILRRIEPTLPTILLVAGAGTNSYALIMPSESGEKFSIVRRPNGKVAFTCAPPGRGGCPPSGTWE